MLCPSCGKELKGDARFCPACGQKIERKKSCPRCGAEPAEGAAFCAACGAAVGAPAPQAAMPGAAAAEAKPGPEKKAPGAGGRKRTLRIALGAVAATVLTGVIILAVSLGSRKDDAGAAAAHEAGEHQQAAGSAEIPAQAPTPEPAPTAPVLTELSDAQKRELMSQLQSFAEVAYEKPFLSTGVHAAEELFVVERATLYYVYTMVETLYHDAWEQYGREWSDRANAFRDAFGEDCYLENDLAYIPEKTIRSVMEALYGGDMAVNWGGVFQDGYYVYEEYDSEFYLTFLENGETDWDDPAEIVFPYEYDDWGDMYYGSIRFTLEPDAASPYGRIVTGFAFDKQTEAALPGLVGTWVYWGTLTGWEDGKYLSSPIPEEELVTDGRGHTALEIDGETGAYMMEFYGDMLIMTETGNGEYTPDDPIYGSFTLVDANTLHHAVRGDIEVYKRNDPYPDMDTGGSVGFAAENGGLVNGRMLPAVSTFQYPAAELLLKAQVFANYYGCSVQEALRIARNECFANYGNVFRDEKLNQYFYVTQGAWFRPNPGMTSELINSLFNSYEQANIKTIQELEERFQ